MSNNFRLNKQRQLEVKKKFLFWEYWKLLSFNRNIGGIDCFSCESKYKWYQSKITTVYNVGVEFGKHMFPKFYFTKKDGDVLHKQQKKFVFEISFNLSPSTVNEMFDHFLKWYDKEPNKFYNEVEVRKKFGYNI
jgi:hypothetical protein